MAQGKERQLSELESRNTQLAQKLEATHSELSQKVFTAEQQASQVRNASLLHWCDAWM